MINQRKQTCWVMRNRDWAMLKIESLQKLKNSDKKEGGSADAKSLVLHLDCTGLIIICISS